jgi:phage-related minor tail protein
MSVDIASLVIEIDSTQAVVAVANLDKLTAAGERAQGSAGRVRTATEQAGIGIKQSADASAVAAKSATDLANSQGAVEKATRSAAAAWMSAKTANAAVVETQRDMVRQVAATTAELGVYQAKMLAATMAQTGMTEAQAAVALGFREAASAEKAAGAVSAETRAARALDAAAMRELVKASKDFERDTVASARTAAAGEAAASAERTRAIMADRALEAAAQRELVAASKAYDRDMVAAQVAADREAAASAAAAAKEEAAAAKAAAAEEIAAQRARTAAILEARTLEMAAQRESVLASKQYDAAQLASARTAETLAAKVDKIRVALDPMAASQVKAAASMATLNAAREKGVIAEAEYLTMTRAIAAAEKEVGAVSAAASAVEVAGHTRVVGSALKVREVFVLVREALRGDFTRMAGSVSILAGAFGALAPAVLPFTLAILAVGAVLGGLFYLLDQGVQKFAKFNNAMKATGDYAGISFSQLLQSSEKIATATNSGLGSVEKTMEAIVASGKVTGATVALVTDASVRLANLTGQKSEEVAKQLVGFYGDASKKALELNDSVHFLTAGLYGQIKAAQDAGDSATAMQIAMKALDDELEARGNPQMSGLNGLLHDMHTWLDTVINDFGMWGRVMDGVSTGIDKIKDAQAGLARHPQEGLLDTFGHMVPTKDNLQASADLFLGHNRAYYQQELASGQSQLDVENQTAAQKAALQAQRQLGLAGVVEGGAAEQRLRVGDPNLIRKLQADFWAKQQAARDDSTLTAQQRSQTDWLFAHQDQVNEDIRKRNTRATSGGKTDKTAERLQALDAEAQGNRLLATSTDLTTEAGVKALAMQKALIDAAKTSKAGTDLQTQANKLYGAELSVVVTAAAKQAETEAAATNAKSAATEQATTLVQTLGVSQGVANQMVADSNELAKLHADYDAASLKDKPMLAKAIADTAAAQERKNMADQAAFLTQAHQGATDQLDQLRLEASLIGATNEQRAVAIAQLKAEQTLKLNNVSATLPSGFANPAYAKYVEDAKRVATATAENTKSQDAFNQSLTFTSDMLSLIDQRARDAASGISNSFGTVGTAIGNVLTTLTAYGAKQAAIEAQREQLSKAGTLTAQKAALLDEQASAASIKNYGDMAAAASSFFGKQTAAYKILHGAEAVFRAFELASAIKSFITKTTLKATETAVVVGSAGIQTGVVVAAEATTTAVSLAGAAARIPAKLAEGAATMFAHLGPFAWPVIAAMVATVAAFGFSALSGGGSGSSGPSAADLQKAQGTGTVLGDTAAKSASIQKALDQVSKNTNKDLEYSNAMASSLRSIDAQMGALTSVLARSLQLSPTSTGGLTAGVTSSGFGLANGAAGLGLGAAGFLAGGALAGTLGALAANGALALGASTALAGSIGTAILGAAGPIGLAIGALAALTLKTKVETDLKDSGVLFGNQSIADVLQNGVKSQSYQDFTVTQKTNFLGIGAVSKSTSNVEQTQALAAETQKQISLVVTSIASTVVAAAQALGVQGADATIKNFQIEIGKLSLQGLTGQDLTDAISAVFSKLGDQMADFVVPEVEKFQKAGEGLFETLVRVAREYQIVDVSLQSIGKTFGAVGVASLAAREDLLSLFASVDDFVTQTQFFADNFLTDAQRIAPIQAAVQKQFAALGVTGVNTKDQFAQLVLGLDLTTDAGRQMYAAMLAVAPAFAKVMDYITGGSKDVTDATDALTKAYQAEADAIQATIDKFQGFSDNLKAFRSSLDTGPNALLTPEAQYNATKAAFLDTAAKAQLGDPTALGNLQGVSQSYLDASKAYYASSGKYFQDLAAVKTAVTASQATAQRTVDNATQQLTELQASVSGLITINQSVLSVHDAIVALQAALAAAGVSATTTPFSPAVSATGSTTPGFTYTPPVAATATPDPGAITATIDPTTLTPDQINAIIQANVTSTFAGGGGRNFGDLGAVQMFAAGGVFTNGIVSQPTSFNNSQMGEAGPEAIMPLVRGPNGLGVRSAGGANDNGEVVDEIKALREDNKALSQRLERVLALHGEATINSNEKVGQRIERAVAKPSTAQLKAGGRA